MKFTIVTVCFNSASTIADTLRSVAMQTHVDIEHIIVDGGSIDGTLDQVREHGTHVAKVVSEKDRGIYDAMNKGLHLATGDAIGFLNSDDMLADALVVERIARGFMDASTSMVYGDLVFVHRSDPSQILRYWRPGLHTSGLCTKGWMAPHPTFYVRRDVLLANGDFNLQYELTADFELMLRLFEVQKLRSMYLPQTLVRMRMGGATTGSLRNILRSNLEHARACRNHGFAGGLGFILGKLKNRVPQYFARPTQ